MHLQVNGRKHGESQILFVTEDIQYTLIWWEFTKLQWYVPH